MNKKFYNFLCSVLGAIYALLFPARVDGLENLPKEGPYILCCNHISARDPFYLAIPVKNRFFHFMAKVELFRFPPLAAFMRGLMAFPVDRGHNDLNAVRTALKPFCLSSRALRLSASG